MRVHLLCCVLVACTSHSPSPESPHPVALEPQVAVAPVVAPLDETSVKTRSRAFFDAFDRGDIHAIGDVVAPSFVWFENARFIDREAFAKVLAGRADRHDPVRSREWTDERVYLGDGQALYFGEAKEHVPATAERPAFDDEGWNTLVWVRDGGAWKVAHWQWVQGGVEAERAMWNTRFRASSGFKLSANQLLIDSVKGRKAGAALDLLMGQGRNALYLARQGWRVTGVDISDVGLRMAQDAAAKEKLKLETIQADVDHWDLGRDRWDLITMIYAGDDAKLVERIKPALKKGGLFVLEYFHADSDAKKMGAGGWATGQLAKLFEGAGFKILRDDVVDDIADWSLRKQKLVRFVAEKL
jgi:SAM-dependent methyltransferase